MITIIRNTRAELRQGVSPSDVTLMRKAFADKGLDFEDHAIRYCYVSESWCVYSSRDLGDLVASSADGWEAK